jgi:hypothetical protein
MSEGIPGFSPLQKELADRIWSMDTQQQVEQYVDRLPKNLKREAYVVIMMIIAQELDTVMEVTDEVRGYIASL